MAAPSADGLLGGVILRKVVTGQLDGQTLVQVAEVFLREGAGFILRVTKDEDLSTVVVGDDVDPGFGRTGEDVELSGRLNLLCADLGVAGVRHPVYLIKAAQERNAFIDQSVPEDTEQLVRQPGLLQTVMVVQRSLCSPADVEGGVDVCFRPFHNGTQLVPIGNLFKLHLLHRSAGDNHSVKVLLANILKNLIEFEQVVGRGIFGGVGSGLQKLHIHLKRRIAEHTQQLAFGINFFRHQIENQNPQSTDVLRACAFFGHDKDVFLLKRVPCRKVVGNIDWHKERSL